MTAAADVETGELLPGEADQQPWYEVDPLPKMPKCPMCSDRFCDGSFIDDAKRHWVQSRSCIADTVFGKTWEELKDVRSFLWDGCWRQNTEDGWRGFIVGPRRSSSGSEASGSMSEYCFGDPNSPLLQRAALFLCRAVIVAPLAVVAAVLYLALRVALLLGWMVPVRLLWIFVYVLTHVMRVSWFAFVTSIWFAIILFFSAVAGTWNAVAVVYNATIRTPFAFVWRYVLVPCAECTCSCLVNVVCNPLCRLLGVMCRLIEQCFGLIGGCFSACVQCLSEVCEQLNTACCIPTARVLRQTGACALELLGRCLSLIYEHLFTPAYTYICVPLSRAVVAAARAIHTAVRTLCVAVSETLGQACQAAGRATAPLVAALCSALAAFGGAISDAFAAMGAALGTAFAALGAALGNLAAAVAAMVHG